MRASVCRAIVALCLPACTYGLVTDQNGEPMDTEVTFKAIAPGHECTEYTTTTRSPFNFDGRTANYAFNGNDIPEEIIPVGQNYVVRVGSDSCHWVGEHHYRERCPEDRPCRRLDFTYTPDASLCRAFDDYFDLERCGMRFYFGSFHSHSRFSGGDAGPRTLLRTTRDGTTCNGNGFDFLTVSDHGLKLHLNEWGDLEDAVKAVHDPGRFTAMRGFEWTSSPYGHIVTLRTDKKTSALSGQLGTPGLYHFYDWIDDEDGLGIFAHPKHKNYVYKFRNFAYHSKGAKVMVGLATNAGADDSNAGGKFWWAYVKALHNGWRVGPTADQDHAVPYHCAPGRTVVIAPELTRRAIYDALQARRFYSSDDHNTEVIFQARGRWMGSEISVSPDEEVELFIKVTDDEPIRTVEVYGDLRARKKLWVRSMMDVEEANGKYTVRLRHRVKRGNKAKQHFYARVTGVNQDAYGYADAGDEQVTLTAPIWLTE